MSQITYRERLKEILKLLSVENYLTIQDLCEKTFCSKSTIRRDLIQLESENLVSRTRGGVRLNRSTAYEFSDIARINTNQAEKKYMAQLAVQMIKNDMVLFFDSSSTVMALIPLLNQFHNLTIITNGVRTAQQLISLPNISTFMCCGVIKPNSSSVIGDSCIKYLQQFSADLAILSCNCCDLKYFYETDTFQAEPKRQMLECAKKTMLLADNRKLNHTALCRISEMSSVDYFVTDQALSEEQNLLLPSNTELMYEL